MRKRAINGGEPLFKDMLHVGRPNIGNREELMWRINAILDRNWLSNHGPMVSELEQQLAARLNVRHCIAMCNGTVALEVAIRALGLKGEVIVPSLTFIATAHALEWQGITSVFCDVDPETLCIDPTQVEKLITPDTTGIIGVHLYGRPADINALKEVADKYNLKLMYDAAHAFSCSAEGTMIGNFGACEVFSFHATKFFNTFEGGAVVTNDNELAEKIRKMHDFGYEELDDVIYAGTNGKMTEICAAMGLTGLESLDGVIAVNKRNYDFYREGLSRINGLELLEFNEVERCNYQYVIVRVGSEYPYSRDELMEILHAENILVRRYFWPGCHQMEPYRTRLAQGALSLPFTEEAAMEVLAFPTGKAISETMIDQIISVL